MLVDATGGAQRTATIRPGFPGRTIGAAALIAGPLLWGAGLVGRLWALHAAGFSAQQRARFAGLAFTAPAQLAAYAAAPRWVTAGYALFLAGVAALVPAVCALSGIVGTRSRRLAYGGGTLVLMGLLARAYFARVEQMAFHLVTVRGLDPATGAVSASYVGISYGPWRLPVTASVGQYVGSLLLVAGAYRSGVFGTGRSVLLLWWATMWMGVLKASTWPDIVDAAALCVVLVPLGVRVLRERAPRPAPDPAPGGWRRRILSW